MICILSVPEASPQALALERRHFINDGRTIIMVGQQVEKDAPPIVRRAGDQASAVFVTIDRPGIMTGIDIPSIGCWEITARYKLIASALSYQSSLDSQICGHIRT